MRAAVVGSSTLARMVGRDLAELHGVEVVLASGPESMDEALEGCDVVLGCLGPDRALEEKAARAAIAARLPYVSGAETPESFQTLTELDEEASSAGSLVVAGMSWSPGLTNLMAAMASSQLDEVLNVRIAWTGSCLGPLGASLLSRAIRSFSGDAALFEDGEWRLESAGARRERVFFPEPAGWRPVAVCAASEPLSIPECIPGVRKVWVEGGIFEPWAHAMALRASDPWGASSDSPQRLNAPSRAAAWVLSRAVSELQAWSAVRVDVSGSKLGEDLTVTLGLVDQLPNLAAGALAAGAMLVGGAKGDGHGVFAPEQVFDPAEFFSFVGGRGIRLARLHGGQELVHI